MVPTYGTTGENEWRRAAGHATDGETGFGENLKLGHDIRFLLVVLGGGAVQVGRLVARRHLRYLETVAINCDTRVQEADDFDRRIYLGPESGSASDTRGSPLVGHQLARSAQPTLERLFEEATFVTVVASLGGATGTGALPVVLEAAARSSEVLSVFVLRPFEAEGERRAIADRALARLNFLAAWVEKKERARASLQVLDNEALARREPKLPFRNMNAHWGELISNHIEKAFLIPAEAAVDANRIAVMAEAERLAPVLEDTRPVILNAPSQELPPTTLPPPLVPSAGLGRGIDAELTFEVDLGAEILGRR
ncbi:MAG: hypothetical protein WCA77_03970 [Thermoplasmata archaeon]